MEDQEIETDPLCEELLKVKEEQGSAMMVARASAMLFVISTMLAIERGGEAARDIMMDIAERLPEVFPPQS